MKNADTNKKSERKLSERTIASGNVQYAPNTTNFPRNTEAPMTIAERAGKEITSGLKKIASKGSSRLR